MIDFVLPWVDGNDPTWREQYLNYKRQERGDTTEARFRDWNNLQYWFRGVEKYTPWVNRIHFITWGHLPDWLNISHPKLNIVKHIDYIPEKYLPTFNSRTIDLNFHRIKGLSEEYVLFNDDVFLINHVKKEKFFKQGEPCDMAITTALGGINNYSCTFLKDILTLNKYFNKYKAIKRKPLNWFNLKYGRSNIKNLLLLIEKKRYHTGFTNFHLSQPLRKGTLALLWDKEYSLLDKACRHTFRNESTVNIYLQRYWELASNNFHPINLKKLGMTFRIREELPPGTIDFLRNQKKPIVCLNDYNTLPKKEFLRAKEQINAAFEEILPEKSDFEI
jgi:hypothetical protein